MHDIISIKIPIYIQYYDNENNITNKKISDKIIKLKLTNDLKLYEILNSTIQTLFNYSIEWIKKNNYNVKLASFIIVDLNKQIRFFKCFNRLDYIVCIVRDINLPPYELLIKNEIKISNEYTLPSTLVKSHFTDTFYNKIKDLTREEEIKKIIPDCIFIRYKPNLKNFNIFKIINVIVMKI